MSRQSDEAAHRFLNEIKAIFGIERCFFVISVSESALSSFERRGLPFRDAFDSAFDSIIDVDYLDLAEARKLISRRVIGLPMPFVSLCHCLSGGLARDLIRVCRELIDAADTEPRTTSLSKLTQSLVRTDLKRKLRAITVAAQRIDMEPDRSEFLTQIAKLDPSGDAAVLREAGTNLICEEDMDKAVTKLTRARQNFATSPGLARSFVTQANHVLNRRRDVDGLQSLPEAVDAAGAS